MKVQNFEVVNSAICAILVFITAKNWPVGAEVIFLLKIYFEIFPKTNVVSVTFESRYIHGQSLKETDFLTRNTVD